MVLMEKDKRKSGPHGEAKPPNLLIYTLLLASSKLRMCSVRTCNKQEQKPANKQRNKERKQKAGKQALKQKKGDMLTNKQVEKACEGASKHVNKHANKENMCPQGTNVGLDVVFVDSLD